MARVAVIGLGKLGAPLAAVFASKGHKVIGVDLDASAVEKINHGIAPIEETNFPQFLKANPFPATTSYLDAVKVSDLAFIIVPTPSNPDGSFDNKYVLDAVRSLGEALRSRKRHYTVVICSTVMPGSTTGPIRQELEEASGRIVGDTLSIAYSPEFIALGSVIEDLLHPDVTLVGESDKKAGDKLVAFFRTINNAPIRRMSLTSAEIGKISVNSYVTMKISFANVLGELCEKTADADALAIANAIGIDSRIGRKYLTPGVSFGGPCFPRDSRAYAVFADGVGGSTDLADATASINDRQVIRICDLAKRFCQDNRIGILGLSYKPDTSISEESFGTKMAVLLEADGFDVHQHDPTKKQKNSTTAGSVLAACSVAVIATPWPQYADLAPLCFERNSQLVIIDCWNIIQAGPWEALNVYRVGIG